MMYRLKAGANLSVSHHLVGGGSRPVNLSAEILPVVNHQLLYSQQGLVPNASAGEVKVCERLLLT